jgi:hypothetical protein
VNHGARDRVSWKLANGFAEADDPGARHTRSGCGRAPRVVCHQFRTLPRLAACRAARLDHRTNVASPWHTACDDPPACLVRSVASSRRIYAGSGLLPLTRAASPWRALIIAFRYYC